MLTGSPHAKKLIKIYKKTYSNLIRYKYLRSINVSTTVLNKYEP